jgi:RecA/RadA recombinase
MKIIGIAGPKGSGKDTVADHICRRLETHVKMAFAEPMKEMLAVGLGLTHEQLHGSLKEDVDLRYGVTPRHLLETLGTEWGRNMILLDLWFQATKSRIAEMVGFRDGVVLSDVRFENEAAFVREHGFLIHIEGRGGADEGHESRMGVVKHDSDIIVCNTRGLPELYAEVDRALRTHGEWAAVLSPCQLQDQGDEMFCSTCGLTGDKPEGVLCPNA